MKKDYHRDLETAARQMILVHKVDTLIRLILRTIIRKVQVSHSGIFLYDKNQDAYVVTISKGEKGLRIPAGFAKVNHHNPIIQYFTDHKLKRLKRDFLIAGKINYYLSRSRASREKREENFLKTLREEMSLLGAKACVPGFFRKNLIGVLFLGEKKDRTCFHPEELGFLSVLASDVVMAIQNAWLVEDLRKQLDTNKQLFLNTVTALAAAVEAKDKYTSGHTGRVVKYVEAITESLKNLNVKVSSEFRENLRIAALLHDIGKIGVPQKILNKKGTLSKKERTFIFKHPLVGLAILTPINEFKEVMLAVKYHHERWDGDGYPFGLKGEKIPLIASIISVADAFDAMITDRPYRKAISRQEAINEIKRNRGAQFSPLVTDAFLKAVEANLI